MSSDINSLDWHLARHEAEGIGVNVGRPIIRPGRGLGAGLRSGYAGKVNDIPYLDCIPEATSA